MAIELPSGDSGTRNLPVPVAPSFPAGLGERGVSASPKVKDGLEPIIMSMDLINESIDMIASVVSESDMKQFSVSDLDKLFQKYLSKQALSDAITLAFTKQSPPAIDSSLLVRQQVKANEVIQKQPSGRFEDVFSKRSSSLKSSSTKKGGSFEDGYNKVVDTAYTTTHDPLKLLDKLIPSLAGLFKKGSKEKSNKKESFYGQGDVEEGSFYGSFGSQASKSIRSTMRSIEGVSDVGGYFAGGRPLGTATDPIYILNAKEDGVTSSKDDIQEEAIKVGIQADKTLTDTLEDPEQSSFANFVTAGGDRKGSGSKKDGKEKDSGWKTVLIVGMVLAALVIFKDVVEKIFDKVLIPLGEILIDFLQALKEPFIAFISAFLDVAVVVFGIIKDVLEAIKPYLIQMAEAFCSIFVVWLGIVQEILLAVKPYIISIAEVIAGTVLVVLTIIKDILVAIAPHLIFIAGLFGGIAVKIVGAIDNVVSIITYPLRIMAKILDTLEPHIIRIANFVGGVIADWFENNEDKIKSIMTHLSNIASGVAQIVSSFLSGFGKHSEGIGDAVGGILEKTLTSIDSFLGKLTPILDRVSDGLFSIAGVFANIFGDVGKAAGELGNRAWNATGGRFLRWTGLISDEDESRSSSSPASFEVLKDVLGIDSSSDQIVLLQGIHKNVEVIANLLFEVHKEVASSIISAKKSNDLIISSDGQIFEPSPQDSIFAVKNGSVSLQPSYPVSSVSANPSVGTESTQKSQTSNVTNVYNSSSNVDLSGINPFSEFCPVGV